MTNVCPPNHAEYWGAGNARGRGGGGAVNKPSARPIPHPRPLVLGGMDGQVVSGYEYYPHRMPLYMFCMRRGRRGVLGRIFSPRGQLLALEEVELEKL